MSNGGRLNVLSKWFGAPSPDGLTDWRLTQWRANYDEARAIARYFRWLAGRRGMARSGGTQGRV
jgi:hypothetical protein